MDEIKGLVFVSNRYQNKTVTLWLRYLLGTTLL